MKEDISNLKKLKLLYKQNIRKAGQNFVQKLE